jgi:hypothetical protein
MNIALGKRKLMSFKMEYDKCNELERSILDQIAIVGTLLEGTDTNTTSMFLGVLQQKLESGKSTIHEDIYALGCACYEESMQKIYS